MAVSRSRDVVIVAENVGWRPPKVAVFEPVSVSFEGDDFCVV